MNNARGGAALLTLLVGTTGKLPHAKTQPTSQRRTPGQLSRAARMQSGLASTAEHDSPTADYKEVVTQAPTFMAV